MKKIYKVQTLAALLAAGSMVIGGCAGKTDTATDATQASTQTQETTSEATTDAEQTQQPGQTQIPEGASEFAKIITSYTRASGTEGEKEAAKTIEGFLSTMGYETSLQPFTQKAIQDDEKDVTGTNVIGIKRAEGKEDADILYITAHHDAKPGIEGAEDDGAGVAVLLETARLIAQVPSDTEIRFITFSGEEDGRVGSRFYVENLTQEERDRSIGQIQLDDLGYWGSEYLQLSTVDGEATMLGDMLSETASHTPNVGRPIPYIKEEMSDHNPFHTYGIAAVALGQDSFAFENHSTQDRLQILDPKRLQQTARLVSDVSTEIMGEETASLLEKAYEGKTRQIAYTIQPDTVIQFDMNRNYVENMMGLSGVAKSESTNEYGDLEEIYEYPVCWFGMETPLPTAFHYRNGYLEMAELSKQDALGADVEQVKELIAKALGEPTSENIDDQNRKTYSWEDEAYHKYYSLEYGDDGAYHVIVLNYNMGKNILATFNLAEGMDVAKAKTEGGNYLDFLELIEKIVSPDDYAVTQFVIYSDGRNASTGFTSAVEENDNTQMTYGLDITDAFDEEGNYREYNKTVRTAVHEYGHVISLNSTQVDMTKQDDSMPAVFYDQETFGEDSYMRAFYEKFWKDLDVKSGLEAYEANPEQFVSAYGANNMSEDFAESFAQFVLSSKPQDDSVASQKIQFFYDYEDMVARRDFIRGNLGIEETSGKVAPDLKEGDFRVELLGNPTTGYLWQYSMDSTDIVKEAHAGYYQNYENADLVGAGGVYLFDFTGVKEGTTDVTFRYVRPWMQGEPDQEKVYRLTVDGEGKVTGEEVK